MQLFGYKKSSKLKIWKKTYNRHQVPANGIYSFSKVLSNQQKKQNSEGGDRSCCSALAACVVVLSAAFVERGFK